MNETSFIYAQIITGMERKAIAALFGEVLNEQVTYIGPPSFAYEVGGWRLEKDGVLRSPQIDISNVKSIQPVFEALQNAGIIPEGNACVIISADAHTGGTLRNLCNVISSKATLIAKALGRNTEAIPPALVEILNTTPIDTVDDFVKVYKAELESGRIENAGDIRFDLLPGHIGFSFFNPTIMYKEVITNILFSYQLNQHSLKLKHTSAKEKEILNDKYAMRTFLLRLGFIGQEYKISRKILLMKLNGDGSFRDKIRGV